MIEKQCTRCKEIKDLSLFSENKRTPDGYRYCFKDCDKIYKIGCKKPVLKNEHDKTCKKAHPLAFNQFFMNVKGIGINA